MNYEANRNQIAKLLKAVEGQGMVIDHIPHTTDWKAYLNRYKVPHPYDADREMICVCCFTRRPVVETADRDEASKIVAADIEESWEITLIYGLEDDEDHPSEEGFMLMLDRICEKFRFMDQLGGLEFVYVSSPVSVQDAYPAMFGSPEGVLCHKGVMILKVKMRDNNG